MRCSEMMDLFERLAPADRACSWDNPGLLAGRFEKEVKRVTPKHNIWKNMFHAFWMGGLFCLLGQYFINGYLSFGMDKETAGKWNLLTLILISVLLTGFNQFGKLVKLGGAGAIVPITGFANSVCSPALEFKSEGFITGMAAKMFIVAGPIIVYGVLAGSTVGFIYYIIGLFSK